MQWIIHHLSETGSTNEDAFRMGRSGAPSGTVCTADRQLHGRGRMDRSWFSPSGVGLYCSVLLRPSIVPEDTGLLSLCAAMAMTDTLRSFGLQASVKWPNDIVFEGKKLCGILSVCDMNPSALRFAVIGSGLNLLPGSYPEELQDRAACLADFGLFPDRQALLNHYLNALENTVSDLEEGGFRSLRQRFENVSVLVSRFVRVSGGQKAEGIAEGIGEHGELLLRLADGSVLPVTCGDVSVRGIDSYV